jgi:hypothetical protein
VLQVFPVIAWLRLHTTVRSCTIWATTHGDSYCARMQFAPNLSRSIFGNQRRRDWFLRLPHKVRPGAISVGTQGFKSRQGFFCLTCTTSLCDILAASCVPQCRTCNTAAPACATPEGNIHLTLLILRRFGVPCQLEQRKNGAPWFCVTCR